LTGFNALLEDRLVIGGGLRVAFGFVDLVGSA
jgi:hypothetical protein